MAIFPEIRLTIIIKIQSANRRQQNQHDKYLLLCIHCWDTPGDVQWTCPKHVEYFIK